VLFRSAKEILGSNSPVEYLSADEILKRRPEEATAKGIRFLVEHMCFDIGKAEKLLGYDPQYSPEEGLIESLKWCMDEKRL